MKSKAAVTLSILFTSIMMVVALVAVQVTIPAHFILSAEGTVQAQVLGPEIVGSNVTDDVKSDPACVGCCIDNCSSCSGMHPAPTIPSGSLSANPAEKQRLLLPSNNCPYSFHQPSLRPPIAFV
ncbi:hypothetical protein [Motiliproteus sp. MSK22-1]|uniref:hypothetical protein n=1 Tax=Motiliproteus sp. MSK22-1 TaxID=1897630 RepID=UPI000977B3E9|nr:hypothetical protein [Motiliproteus sp. MSK22-1]OMH31768.1 hypothetical protein BGP75_16770 [Motiliproteus sp. MSK22-1]